MNINILPYAMLWGVLAIAVLCLIFYRRSVASHEDDSIHLEGSVSMQQATVAHKLAVIDAWGKTLTTIAAVYGLAVAGLYLYQVWNSVPTY